jgi:hypothetical protein
VRKSLEKINVPPPTSASRAGLFPTGNVISTPTRGATALRGTCLVALADRAPRSIVDLPHHRGAVRDGPARRGLWEFLGGTHRVHSRSAMGRPRRRRVLTRVVIAR